MSYALLVLPERGRHELVDGNWSRYAEIVAERERTKREGRTRTTDEDRRRVSPTGPPAKRKSRSKYAGRKLEALEAQIIEREARLADLAAAFADTAAMKDAEKARRLHLEYEALRRELADLNARWETAVDAHDD